MDCDPDNQRAGDLNDMNEVVRQKSSVSKNALRLLRWRWWRFKTHQRLDAPGIFCSGFFLDVLDDDCYGGAKNVKKEVRLETVVTLTGLWHRRREQWSLEKQTGMSEMIDSGQWLLTRTTRVWAVELILTTRRAWNDFFGERFVVSIESVVATWRMSTIRSAWTNLVTINACVFSDEGGGDWIFLYFYIFYTRMSVWNGCYRSDQWVFKGERHESYNNNRDEVRLEWLVAVNGFSVEWGGWRTLKKKVNDEVRRNWLAKLIAIRVEQRRWWHL